MLATELFKPIITPRTSVGTSAKAAINGGRDKALNKENPIPRNAVVTRPGVQRNHASAKLPDSNSIPALLTLRKGNLSASCPPKRVPVTFPTANPANGRAIASISRSYRVRKNDG